jgi:hypothetical protein
MTRSDNLNRWYFVPGASIAVPPGATNWTTGVNIDISDGDLAALATLADENFNYLSQDWIGNGPFSPSVLIPYARRMVYIVRDKAYVSEIDDFQVLTEDQHVIQVPGQRALVTGFQLRGVLYLLGAGFTYATVDNSDVPVLWGAPNLVSGALGTSAPLGVEWRTAGDYAWVANEAGLWLFNGQYSDKPITYLNYDQWKRINWTVPCTVQVRDDFVNQRVHVIAALDAATEPSHKFIIDYSRGMRPDTVDFAVDDFAFGQFSSIGVVQEPSTGKSSVWVGPVAAGAVLREDLNATDDDGSSITSEYETGAVLTTSDPAKRTNRFGGLDLDVAGTGAMEVTVNGTGRIKSERLRDVSLESDPSMPVQRACNLTSSNASIHVKSSGGKWSLERLTVYHKPWVEL